MDGQRISALTHRGVPSANPLGFALLVLRRI
jgi:hypothetical protein